jgi:hypothetical protein
METKRWGPFSGRQLMIMFVAMMAAVVLVPTTVWAVTTGSAVNIIDGTNAAHKATVNADGSVKTQNSNLLTALVAGAVTARVATPGAMLGAPDMTGYVNAPNVCTNIESVPFVATQLTVDTRALAAAGDLGVEFWIFDNDDGCAGASGVLIASVTPATSGITTIPLGVGLSLPNGKKLGVRLTGSGSAAAGVMGYTP